jgi:hypothetical protein
MEGRKDVVLTEPDSRETCTALRTRWKGMIGISGGLIQGNGLLLKWLRGLPRKQVPLWRVDSNSAQLVQIPHGISFLLPQVFFFVVLFGSSLEACHTAQRTILNHFKRFRTKRTHMFGSIPESRTNWNDPVPFRMMSMFCLFHF